MWREALESPRKLWGRKAIFQIHLWAGVVLALYLCVIGISGSLLVFEDELAAMTLPEAQAAQGQTTPVRLEETMAAAERERPGAHVTFVSFPDRHAEFYRVWLSDKAGKRTIRLANAASGGLVAGEWRPWIEWVHDLHIYLLMGETGLVVNGAGAAGLLLLSGTGIVLWWRGLKRWRRGLGVNLRAGWRRINFDLHGAVGLWTLGIALWWGLSGVYFIWPGAVGAVVNALSATEGMRPPAIPKETAGSGHAELSAMVEEARRETPGGHVSGIAPAASTDGNAIVYVDRGAEGDFSHRDIDYFSARTGRLLATWHYGENRTVGDWILWAMHPLHFGTLWGLGPKMLWAALGLSLPLLSVTGLVMYWNRKLRHLWRRAG